MLDRFDRLDENGDLVLREEDIDANGSIDVRSIYSAGRLVRRELATPALDPRRDGTPAAGPVTPASRTPR